MFVPIYLLFVNSLKDEVQSRAMGVEFPTSIHLENYLTVIEQGKLGIAFVNSTALCHRSDNNRCCLFDPAAFVLSRNRSPRNRFLVFFHYFGDRNADKLCNLNEGYAGNSSDQYCSVGIIILYAATKIPFGVFLIYAFVEFDTAEKSMRRQLLMVVAPYALFHYYFSFAYTGLGDDSHLKLFRLLERIYPSPVFLAKFNKVAHDFGGIQFLWHV